MNDGTVLMEGGRERWARLVTGRFRPDPARTPMSKFAPVLFGVALCVSVSTPCLAGEAKPITSQLQATAAVDAEGHVIDVRFKDSIPEVLREPLHRDIVRWQFEPAQRDGVAVSSETHLAIDVRATPINDGEEYELRIIDASNGPAYGQAPAPRYPMNALRNHVSAKIELEVDIRADGTVAGARVESLRLSKERYGTLISQAAVDAVMQWTFLPEQVDGRAIPATVHVPITFCVQRRSCFNDAEGQSDSATPQQLIAEEPAVRLLTDVVGRTL